MPQLITERCEACTGSTPTLSTSEVTALLAELSDGWNVTDEGRLHRSFRYTNFRNAFAMATKVALLAEAEGHHPEMTAGWGHLDVELHTHAVGGLTRNDFIVAAKVDAL